MAVGKRKSRAEPARRNSAKAKSATEPAFCWLDAGHVRKLAGRFMDAVGNGERARCPPFAQLAALPDVRSFGDLEALCYSVLAAVNYAMRGAEAVFKSVPVAIGGLLAQAAPFMVTDFRVLVSFARELFKFMRAQATEAAALLTGWVLCAVYCRSPDQCACTDVDRATGADLIGLGAASREKRRVSGERALALLKELKVYANAMALAAWNFEVEATLGLLAAHSGTAEGWNAPASDVQIMPCLRELELAEAYERTRFPGNKYFFFLFAMYKAEGDSVGMAREQASVLRGGFLNPRNLPAPGFFRAASARPVGALPGERFYDGTPLTHALKVRAAVGTNENVAPVTFVIPYPTGTRVVYGVPAPTWTVDL